MSYRIRGARTKYIVKCAVCGFEWQFIEPDGD